MVSFVAARWLIKNTVTVRGCELPTARPETKTPPRGRGPLAAIDRDLIGLAPTRCSEAGKAKAKKRVRRGFRYAVLGSNEAGAGFD